MLSRMGYYHGGGYIADIYMSTRGDLQIDFPTLQTGQDVSRSASRWTCFYVSGYETGSVTGTTDFPL